MMAQRAVVVGAAALAGALALTAPAAAQESSLTPAYDACMDASSGVTFDMIDCMTAEYERQDARLNHAYKAAMGILSPDRQEALRAAQRLWIKYRDANCDFYADPQGGTIARLDANSCMLHETADRALELEIIGAVDGY